MEAKHSADFASVAFGGELFTFTAPQRRVIAALWQAHEDGTPVLSDAHLIEVAGSSSDRLRDVFKSHPAWGSLVVSAGKGMRKLSIENSLDRPTRFPLPYPSVFSSTDTIQA